MQETGKHLTNAHPLAVKYRSGSPRESLLELIEALQLLSESHAGMRKRQAGVRRIESGGNGAQLASHGAGEPLLELVEAL
jgi:hypothetical protein